VLFFLCKGTTCASLSLSGNVDVSKDSKDIGSQNIKTDDNHPSIKAIKENKTESDQFIFNPINEEFVNKEINKILYSPEVINVCQAYHFYFNVQRFFINRT
jgi:hypothetical protein